MLPSHWQHDGMASCLPASSRSCDQAACEWGVHWFCSLRPAPSCAALRRCIADNKPRSFDAERAMMLTNMVRL